MIILGLTGSIGMGKSTTADMFRDLGIPVHDADATVHDLYLHTLTKPLAAAFPGILVDGVVDRALLSKKVLGNEPAMKKLEAIVHPAVQERELSFLTTSRENGETLVVLDIPLLFEVGAEKRVDKIVVVTAPEEVQRQRVLAREGMTEEKFKQIVARQIPDKEKQQRADFIIDTSKGIEFARKKVAEICGSFNSQ